MLCSWTRSLTLTMPHSSNNITFGGLGGTHTCKNKTTFPLSEILFVLFFYKIFPGSQTQKEFSNITEDKSYFQAVQCRSFS